jgi:hypothetical protein
MSLTIVMQDLVTVAIDVAGTAIQVTQPEDNWVDLGPYQDLGLATYISEQGYQTSSGGAAGSLLLQSSPLKEDAAFSNLVTINANTTPSYWSSPANFHLSSGSNTFFRWARWRLVGPTANGTAAWTFRIVLMVNPAPR